MTRGSCCLRLAAYLLLAAFTAHTGAPTAAAQAGSTLNDAVGNEEALPDLNTQTIVCDWGTLHLGPEFHDQSGTIDRSIGPQIQRIRQIPQQIEEDRSRCEAVIDAVNTAFGITPDAQLREDQQGWFIGSMDVGHMTLPPADKLDVFVLSQEAASAYVRAGGSLPLLQYDAQRDIVHGTLFFQVTGNTAGGIVTEQAPHLPGITLRVDLDQDLIEQITPRFEQLTHETALAVATHEVIEATHLRHCNRILPRWYSDGVANALAAQILEALGCETAVQFLNDQYLSTELTFPEHELNLRYWQMTDFDCAANTLKERNLTIDRYAASSQLITPLLEDKGVEALQQVLQAIRAENLPPRHHVTSDHLCQLIEHHTDYAISAQLDQYQQFSTVSEAKQLYGPAFFEAREADDLQRMLFNLWRLIEIGIAEDDALVLSQTPRFVDLLEASGETVQALKALQILARRQASRDAFQTALRAISLAGEAGHLALAYPFARAVLMAYPNSPTALLTQADYWRTQGAYQEARAILDQLIEQGEGDGQTPDWFTRYLAQLDDEIDALLSEQPAPSP